MKLHPLFIAAFVIATLPIESRASWQSWTSKNYTQIPIPKEWLPLAGEKQIDHVQVSNWALNQLDSKYILRELGLPNRLQRDREGNYYLLYHFKEGDVFIVYLGTSLDLNHTPRAAALQNKFGKTLNLIK